MARKQEPRIKEPATSTVRSKIEFARTAGHWQKAVELAEHLVRTENTPDHRELLKQLYLDSVRNLRLAGRTREAEQILEAAARLSDQDQGWLGALAEEQARARKIGRALSSFEKVADEATRARGLGHVADAAVCRGPSAGTELPESLRPDLERILRAFASSARSEDEAVTTALQGIGLRSPFLEWKVVLRGLQAYYLNDDARALESWQRLQPDRLPVRLAAPLRYLIDPAFRLAQLPATQTLLQEQADKLQGSGIVPMLRSLQEALVGHSLQPALRVVERLLPTLRQQAPQLVTRLASCLYWTLISPGQTNNIPHYQRLFGPPAEDPNLDRLKALGFEQAGAIEDAHRHWQAYEKWLTTKPAVFPAEHVQPIRALVWVHMARNAALMELPADGQEQMPAFLRKHSSLPRPLSPSAEKCLKYSLELDRAQLATHRQLFEFYRRQKKTDKAITAAQQLLRQFPEHAQTLEELSQLYLAEHRFGEALEGLQHAVKANPLSRSVRSWMGTAHLLLAEEHASAGRVDEARIAFERSMPLREPGFSTIVALCSRAVASFKEEKPEEAEDLLRQAQTVAGDPDAVTYLMLSAAIRMQLPPKLKKRFETDFSTALKRPAFSVAATFAQTLGRHAIHHLDYRGRQTHEKKVLAYLKKSSHLAYTEQQLEEIVQVLMTLRSAKLLLTYAVTGREQYPRNPLFLLLEVESHLLQRDPRHLWRLRELLEEARRLATQQPPSDRRTSLLELIKQAEQKLQLLAPFAINLLNLFDQFPGDDDGDDF